MTCIIDMPQFLLDIQTEPLFDPLKQPYVNIPYHLPPA